MDSSQKPEVSNRNDSLENVCNISSSSTSDSLDGNNISGSSKNQSSDDFGHLHGSSVTDVGSKNVCDDVAETLASAVDVNEKKSDESFNRFHHLYCSLC